MVVSILPFWVAQKIMIIFVLARISLGYQHLQNIFLIIEVYFNSKHYLMVKCVQFVFRRRNDNGDMSSSVYTDLQAKL